MIGVWHSEQTVRCKGKNKTVKDFTQVSKLKLKWGRYIYIHLFISQGNKYLR